MNEGAVAHVVRDKQTFVAKIGSVPVGAFASQSLAERCLDLLRIKAALDGGQALDGFAGKLLQPVQVSHDTGDSNATVRWARGG
jgi:hypothetical protein